MPETCKTFFAAAQQRFHEAVRSSGGLLERDFHIGGLGVRLRFAGEVLATHLTPAFEHLALEGLKWRELVIQLWDRESTGIDLPALPWPVADSLNRGQVWRFENDSFSVLGGPAGGSLSGLDRASGQGFFLSRPSAGCNRTTTDRPCSCSCSAD